MTVPVRAEPLPLRGAELDAARAALAPRVASGDLSALAGFFELSGGSVTSVRWTDEPR